MRPCWCVALIMAAAVSAVHGGHLQPAVASGPAPLQLGRAAGLGDDCAAGQYSRCGVGVAGAHMGPSASHELLRLRGGMMIYKDAGICSPPPTTDDARARPCSENNSLSAMKCGSIRR